MTLPTTTRALTVRQPWADAIAHCTKRVENRTRRTHYRGPLVIHAGQGYDLMGRFHIDRTDLAAWPDTRGAIVAVADLTDCHAYADCCEPWGDWDGYHWTLANVRRLAAPVPCKGRLGLWTPSETVLDAAHDQLLAAPAVSSGSGGSRAHDGGNQ